MNTYSASISSNQVEKNRLIKVSFKEGVSIKFEENRPCMDYILIRELSMTDILSSSTLNEDIFISLEGNNTGIWVEGPVGHPGDFETVERNIKSAQIELKCYSNGLLFFCKLNTGEGQYLYKGVHQKDIKPRTKVDFSIQFFIPLPDFKQLGFDDKALLNFKSTNLNSFQFN